MLITKKGTGKNKFHYIDRLNENNGIIFIAATYVKDLFHCHSIFKYRETFEVT